MYTLPIKEGSAKVRSGPSAVSLEDAATDASTGIVPLQLARGTPAEPLR